MQASIAGSDRCQIPYLACMVGHTLAFIVQPGFEEAVARMHSTLPVTRRPGLGRFYGGAAK